MNRQKDKGYRKLLRYEVHMYSSWMGLSANVEQENRWSFLILAGKSVMLLLPIDLLTNPIRNGEFHRRQLNDVYSMKMNM